MENQTASFVGQKREKNIVSSGSLTVSDLALIAILLAAGVVLKLVVGSVINFFGMKPNFIIAAYCLAILLVRPKVPQALIIGLLAGALCQLLPGTPYINFVSESAGAVVMALLIGLPKLKELKGISAGVATFVATIVSGSVFTLCLFLVTGAQVQGLVAYIPIVLATASINAVLVQILFPLMNKALSR